MKKMTITEYQRMAMRTSPRDGHDKIDNGVLGLIGETGELVDVYKKYMYQSGLNPPVPEEKIADELGDVLWYLAELADGMNASLYEIAERDFDKLDGNARRCGAHKATLRKTICTLSDRANKIFHAVTEKRQRELGYNIRGMLACAARLAQIVGYTLQEVACMNIDKLKKRYPEGFDPEISMGRYRDEGTKDT